MKVKKGVKKGFKATLIIILVVALAAGGYLVYKTVSKNKDAVGKTEIVDKIEGYDYQLEKDAPKVYKNLFNDLRKILKEEPVNEEEYAKTLAQMMAVDFYNLENKISKNDIGGSKFVLNTYRKNFVLEASETVYKYVENNIYGDRKQELPEVTSSEVTSVKTEKYSYKKLSDDKAYIVNVKLGYKKDMGYPTNIIVKLLHNDIKLEVYYMK